MNRILIKSTMLIALFLGFVSVSYASSSLVFEIRDTDGDSINYMKIKTEPEVGVYYYIVAQVTSAENTVKYLGNNQYDWNWNEPQGLDIYAVSQSSTQLVLQIESGYIDSYNLVITAVPEIPDNNATDSCMIYAADIDVTTDPVMAYAAGMDIDYELDLPFSSSSAGIVYISDTMDPPNYYFLTAFSQTGSYSNGIYSYDGTYHWNGKCTLSPYYGEYLPAGDYIVTYSSINYIDQTYLRIVEVDSVSDENYYTGRQYIPITGEEFYLYDTGFYYIDDQELDLWADPDPSGTSFPYGSPVWTIHLDGSPSSPQIIAIGDTPLTLGNFNENGDVGNYTVSAFASFNDDTDGGSIGLTMFNASASPDSEYIAYETGTDITYQINPGSGWSYYSAEVCITDEYGDYVYKCSVSSFTDEIEWDGQGNWDPVQDQSTTPYYLSPGEYWIGVEIIPFYGSEKFCYYTDFYNPNLTVNN